MNLLANMREARNVRRGQRRGEGSGAKGGNGGLGTLCFFAIFCTRCDLRPAILGSEPAFDTCEEVNDDDKTLMGASSPSTTFTVAIGSDCEAASDSTAASRCMKLAMTESNASSRHSSASRSPWIIRPLRASSPWTPSPFFSFWTSSGTLARMASR